MNTQSTSKPELLIVDDDPLIIDTLSFVLGKDYSVRAAGLAGAGQEPAAPARFAARLALVDLGLPPTPHRPDEGFQLITDLLAHSPSIKILVLSGQSDEANARYARTLGAVEFIAKPCEPDVLKAMLAKARRMAEVEQSSAKAGYGHHRRGHCHPQAASADRAVRDCAVPGADRRRIRQRQGARRPVAAQAGATRTPSLTSPSTARPFRPRWSSRRCSAT